MARLTPAGNPAGRFTEEQYAALDSVFAAAAPLTPGEVDALIEELGKLDVYVQLNGLAAEELTDSELFTKFHAIESAADKLIQKLEITEAMSQQIRAGLEYFAKQEAKRTGGFPNYPPETIHIAPDGEKITRFREDRQLQQNIEGIFQIREWARQAKEVTKRTSKRADKESKKAARTREELIHSNIGKGSEFDICDKIFKIWAGLPGKKLGTSVNRDTGAVSGPLVRFTTSCLALLGLPPLTPEAIRARVRRYVAPANMAKSSLQQN